MAYKLREALKILAILLLVIMIFVLTLLALPAKTLTETPWLASLLKPVASYFGISQTELAAPQTEPAAAPAAQPLLISVRGEAGRCSFLCDFAGLDAAYESLGGTLAQALDTAEAPEPSTRQALYAALSGESAAFRYPGTPDCALPAAWLGAETAAAGTAADWFVLQADGDAVRLYLAADTVSVCNTRLSAETLRTLLGAYRPDGSFFAFESQDAAYRNVDGCTLFSAETPYVRKIACMNPCDTRFATSLASELGFNPYGDSTYTDDQGNLLFSETDLSLQLRADGHLLLECSADSRFSARSDAPADQIEAARSLIEKILGQTAEGVRVYLTGTDGSGGYEFSYVVCGLPVLQQDGAAFSFRFNGTRLSSLKALLRSYTPGTEPIPLLPAKQAAAAAEPGSSIGVCYADLLSQELSAGWIRQN